MVAAKVAMIRSFCVRTSSLLLAPAAPKVARTPLPCSGARVQNISVPESGPKHSREGSVSEAFVWANSREMPRRERDSLALPSWLAITICGTSSLAGHSAV